MAFFTLSIIMYLLQNLANKTFSQKNISPGTNTAIIHNVLCTFVSALTLMLFGGFKNLGVEGFFLAFVFGVLYLSTIFFLLKAFMLGEMGKTTLLCNCGMFISAFYGIIKFGDQFTFYIALGFVCLLGAVILSTPKSSGKSGMKWFFFALMSGLTNGAVASAKREAVEAVSDIRSFLALGFLFAALIGVVIVVSQKNIRRNSIKVLKNPALILCGICSGIGTAGANLFQMEAIKTVSSAIVYPLTAGILVVSLWLVSLLVYRETTVKIRNVLSVILCVSAIIFINL